MIDPPEKSKDQAARDAANKAPTAPHRSIAAAMLFAGVALNGYTLYSVFYTESVNKKPGITLITSKTELDQRRRSVIGTYATGPDQGDRVIVVNADGTVRFYEIGSKGPLNDTKDAYLIGLHDGQPCLATPDSGIIEVVGNDTLSYYRDVYKRSK